MTVKRGDNGGTGGLYLSEMPKTSLRQRRGVLHESGGSCSDKEGFYGRQAKRNFERHPGKSAFFEYVVFRCDCGMSGGTSGYNQGTTVTISIVNMMILSDGYGDMNITVSGPK